MQIKDNIAIKDFYVGVRRFLDANQRRLRDSISYISEIDSIREFEVFKNELSKIVGKEEKWTRYANESYYYGHYEALRKYASIKEERINSFSNIEHGIRWGVPREYYNEMVSVITQEPSVQELVHSKFPNTPVFKIGPYIHYAEGVYTKEEIEKIKEKRGKTLLIFPAHSAEGGRWQKEASLYDILMSKYRYNYDSIVACIYWHDVNDTIVEKLEAEGVELVSAGYRSDTNFLNRLKSIIEMCDDVLIDTVGTNLGYCMYLGKRVFCEMTSVKYQQRGKVYNYPDCIWEIIDAFTPNNELDFTESKIVKQNEILNRFWGVSYLRTPEEIRLMHDLADEILHRSRYYYLRFSDTVETMKKELSRSGGKKYLLFNESLE